MITSTNSIPTSPTRLVLPGVALLLLGLSFPYWSREEVPKLTDAGSAPKITIADSVPSGFGPAAKLPGRYVTPARPQTRLDLGELQDTAPALSMMHQRIAEQQAARGQRDQVLSQLESQYRSEPVDARWSGESEVKILSASVDPVMLQAGLTPADMAADCRSKTCKITGSFADPDSAQNWGTIMLNQLGGTVGRAQVAVIPRADGSAEVRIYGRRKTAQRG